MNKLILWCVCDKYEPAGFYFGGSYREAKAYALNTYFEDVEDFAIEFVGHTKHSGEFAPSTMILEMGAQYSCFACRSKNLTLYLDMYECADCGHIGDLELAFDGYDKRLIQ